jgi:protease II
MIVHYFIIKWMLNTGIIIVQCGLLSYRLCDIMYTNPPFYSIHRPYQLWMHSIGTNTTTDILIFQENDGKFWMGAGKTNDEKFLVLSSGSPETSEVWLMSLSDIKGISCSMKLYNLISFDNIYNNNHFFITIITIITIIINYIRC